MMNRLQQLLILALAACSSSVSADTQKRSSINRNSNTGSISSNSQLGRTLLSQARDLNGDDVDYSFVADYSIKFQGCHHVQQWNADVDDEDDVRVRTKRLVRFRLCESDSCSNSNTAGCTSKFGDYVVDMNTYVAAYLEAVEEEEDEICQDANADCQEECGGNDDSECLETCYDGYDVSFCTSYYNNQNGNDDNQDNGFDASEYAACAEYGGRRNRQLDQNANDGYEYYLGPYCADQGGEIHMGLFTDETCTTYAQNGESTFYNMAGYALPFSDSSLVSSRCFTCGDDEDGDGDKELKDFCGNAYVYSGKCETRMNIGYPNESSCSYIEGIKIIREDGVIRTSTTKKSRAAAVCIGLFLTLAVLLAGYVHYLRTKLGRAQINLAAATQSLT